MFIHCFPIIVNQQRRSPRPFRSTAITTSALGSIPNAEGNWLFHYDYVINNLLLLFVQMFSYKFGLFCCSSFFRFPNKYLLFFFNIAIFLFYFVHCNLHLFIWLYFVLYLFYNSSLFYFVTLYFFVRFNY